MKTWLYPLWVIIDVLVWLVVAALWITSPEYAILNWSLTVFAATLGLLLVLMRLAEIKLFVKSRYFERVAFHTINAILVLSILGLLNYLGNKNYKEFDLTHSKKNSLTDQSRKIVEMVQEPLKMTLFAKREEWAPMLTVLKLYEALAPQKIQLTAVDTDLRPDLVRSAEITENGTVVLEYKGETMKFLLIDELSVTNALLKLLRDQKYVLYMVTGHDELSCSNTTVEGISVLCEKLRSQNYEVRELNLAQVKEVPGDASAVMVLGPASGLFPDEARRLEDYLNRGGSLFLALAPAFKSEIYDNLIALGKPFGLTLGRDLVIDRLSTIQGAEATIPIIQNYATEHPITMGFNLRTVFPLSSSVQKIAGNDSATLLARTSDFPGSWAETNLKAVTEGKAEFQEKEDLRGPIGVLGAGEKVGEDSQAGSRFILLGSSSFLINAYQAQSGNTNLFLNAVSWLINDEGIISLNRPGNEEPPVILSSQHLQMIFFISILVVPIVFFGAAIFVYRRRRVL